VIESLGLSQVVKMLDLVSYKKALEYMVNSHLLLLFAPDQPYQIPGKAFEYLASGADVLALTSEGATADLIKRSGRGFVAGPQDVNQIKEALLLCYIKYRCGHLKERPRLSEDLRIYDRMELTKELVSVLND
jgi:glycosyltransferase involved in cell wall biosynthesis